MLDPPRQAGAVVGFFDVLEINDDTTGSSVGDNDGIVDAGETLELRLRLTNTGDADATNVQATIGTTDEAASVLVATQDFVTIANGTVGSSSSYFVVKVNSSCPASHTVAFSVSVISDQGSWEDAFDLLVTGVANPNYHHFTVVAEDDGDLIADDDDVMDPGEVVDVDVFVKNLGNASLVALTGTLAEEDPFVSIDDATGTFGTVASEGGTASGRFGLDISGACPDQHEVAFTMALTDGHGTEWTIQFALVVNGFPNYSILEFDLLQYSSYGDDDAILDAGEQWYASIGLNNTGDAIGWSVRAFFTTTDPHVSFYEDTGSRNRSYGSVEVGVHEVLADQTNWRFTIADATPAGHWITFTVEVTDASGQPKWTFPFARQVVGTPDYGVPEVEFEQYGNYGDEDGVLDAGERMYARITVGNNGSADGHGVRVFFTSSDPHVSFYEDAESRNRSYFTVEAGDEVALTDQTNWRFTIADATPAGRWVTFTVEVTDYSARFKWTFPFARQVVGTPAYAVQLGLEQYSSSGDDDAILDAGEQWYASIDLNNTGSADGHGVRMFFTTTDPHVSFYRDAGSRNRSYSTVEAGDEVTLTDQTNWRFTIADATPAGHWITFSVEITDYSAHFRWVFPVARQVVGTPDYAPLELDLQQRTGTSNGDEDAEIDAGEWWRASITLQNNGSADGHGVRVFFTSSDPYVEFYRNADDRNQSYGTLAAGTNETQTEDYAWRFEVSDVTPAGHLIVFMVEVTDYSSHFKWTFLFPRQVVEGTAPPPGTTPPGTTSGTTPTSPPGNTNPGGSTTQQDGTGTTHSSGRDNLALGGSIAFVVILGLTISALAVLAKKNQQKILGSRKRGAATQARGKTKKKATDRQALQQRLARERRERQARQEAQRAERIKRLQQAEATRLNRYYDDLTNALSKRDPAVREREIDRIARRFDAEPFKYEQEKARMMEATIEQYVTVAREEAVLARKQEIRVELLDLGSRYDRLLVKEVIEACESCTPGDDDLVVQVASDMIAKGELRATYFTSSESIVFDKRANEELLADLDAQFATWGKKDKKD